jgi:hypothetical protein
VRRNAQSTPESCDRHIRKTAIADSRQVERGEKDLGANSLAGGKGESKEQGARSSVPKQDGCIGLSNAACVSERIRILHGEHRALASS